MPPEILPRKTADVMIRIIHGVLVKCVKGMKPIKERIATHKQSKLAFFQDNVEDADGALYFGKWVFVSIYPIIIIIKIKCHIHSSANIVPIINPIAPLDTNMPNGASFALEFVKIIVPAPT